MDGLVAYSVEMPIYALSCPKKRSNRGFTLIETLVAVALTAILLGVGLPSMVKFVAGWQVSNSLNAFTSSLRVARTEAIKRQRNVRMCLSTDGASCAGSVGTTGWASGWIVYVDNNGSGAFNSSTDIILISQAALTLGSIVSTKGNTVTDFVFRSNGLLTAGQQAFNFNSTQGGASPTVIKGICVSTTGRTRVVTNSSTCTSGES